MTGEEIRRCNAVLLNRLSLFLNCEPDFITADMIGTLCGECGVTPEEAYRIAVGTVLCPEPETVREDELLLRQWFPRMFRLLDTAEYCADPYLRTVSLPASKTGRWEFRREIYRPYEAFVYDDLRRLPDGRLLPQIGFFDREYAYPAILEGGREWMLITPNEINTMKKPVAAAHGDVLTYGLGLGYFAFRAAEKPEVSSVTVVEADPTVIRLFREQILPQFGRAAADKLRIVEGDAFAFAESLPAGVYDTVFADIWHDPSDGIPAWKRLKRAEARSPGTAFFYWIEDTMKQYLQREP